MRCEDYMYIQRKDERQTRQNLDSLKEHASQQKTEHARNNNVDDDEFMNAQKMIDDFHIKYSRKAH